MLLALAAVAAGGVDSPEAASPDHAAGIPFVTFQHARAQRDFALACDQFAKSTLLRGISPRPSSVRAARRICVSALRSDDAGVDDEWRRSLAMAHVVKVRVKPGRARVTLQTTLYGLAPRSTGTAIVENGRWKIAEVPGGAHVGRSLVLRIPSEGMLPTLQIGDTILVDQDAYRSSRPQIGDIVVFHPPAGAETGSCAKRPPPGQACATAAARDADVNFVKRIVAWPGDRISIRDGHVIRNGARALEDFVTPCGSGGDGCDFPRTFTVADGRYYVLGDNRGRSDDSRF